MQKLKNLMSYAVQQYVCIICLDLHMYIHTCTYTAYLNIDEYLELIIYKYVPTKYPTFKSMTNKNVGSTCRVCWAFHHARIPDIRISLGIPIANIFLNKGSQSGNPISLY